MDRTLTIDAALNEVVIKPRFSEIDSLSIVHHSRFILWAEEANFSFVERVLAISRKELFELGIYNPIQKLEFKYKNHVVWEDEVLIRTRMEYSQFAFFTMHNHICCRKNPKKTFAEARIRLLYTTKELDLRLLTPDFFLMKIREAEEKYPQFFINTDHA